jgi:hypothetical protein
MAGRVRNQALGQLALVEWLRTFLSYILSLIRGVVWLFIQGTPIRQRLQIPASKSLK